ncbi:hypothetical protein NicSoilE8_05020 [Arthrobacter sp. NicSoilE8]|nr:hypothetical protein NicSoilE8_05020 [Arthrobacter sp. NicSoilE8]
MSTSLATGTGQLARRKLLVKRLVCIEDLGDMDIPAPDKTGTLTEGRISFYRGRCPLHRKSPTSNSALWMCWPPKPTTPRPNNPRPGRIR